MRPVLEVADIFRSHGDAFRIAQGDRLSHAQRRVMAAIEASRPHDLLIISSCSRSVIPTEHLSSSRRRSA